MGTLEILSKYQDAFLRGLLVTLKLCLIIWSSGLLVGSLLGVTGAKWYFTVGIPSRVASFILSGIPVLVFLFWLHYPFQALMGVVIDPFYTAVTTFSIIHISAISDLVRQAIRDFPNQYEVAAQVCGLTTMQTLIKIKIPIIFRQLIPSMLVAQVNMLQITLFASLISVEEIFRVSQQINATVYRPVQIYTAVGIFFLVVCLPLNGLALWLKIRFTRDLSER